MAKPIKETPILYGKDSDRFLNAVKENENNASKKVSKEDYEKSKEIFDAVIRNAEF